LKYKVITPPSAPVITLADLREHLRIEEVAAVQDSLILGWLDSAREYCQHYTQRAIGVQTIEIAIDAFPFGGIELAPAPVFSITSIKYIDASGSEQTVAPASYTVDDYGLQHWALPAASVAWPATLDAANVVKVRYQAGDVPDPVRSAMLLMVHDSFERRGNAVEKEVREVPLGVHALLDTVKSWSL
jgi:uncharacterized phiE125 gp8 family phage protein